MNIQNALLVAFCCWALVACKEETPTVKVQPNDLLGDWTITKVINENTGEEINAVSGGTFSFDADKVTINLAGVPGIESGEPMPYALNDTRIEKVGEFNFVFEITERTENTLVLISDLRLLKAVIHLEKAVLEQPKE
jgi:hypothetical protein